MVQEDFIPTDYTYHYDAMTPEMPHVILFRGAVYARARAHRGELHVFRGEQGS